jgi:hypothetical protein
MTTTIIADEKNLPNRRVVVQCTASETGIFERVDLGSDLTGLLNGALNGWACYLIETKAGATAPTPDSDLYGLSVAGSDLLAGNGVDQVDASGANAVYLPINALPIPTLRYLDIRANLVAGAVVEITLHLYRD